MSSDGILSMSMVLLYYSINVCVCVYYLERPAQHVQIRVKSNETVASRSKVDYWGRLWKSIRREHVKLK